MKMTLVFDGEARDSKFQVGWGLSVYIHEANLLFDTGEDPVKLKHNMDVLGIKKKDIHWVILSHSHFDHVRGISALADASPRILVAPGLLDANYYHELLRQGFVISTGNGAGPILPNVQRLVIGREGVVEQALLIRGEQGWNVLFGCAHWGTDRWIQKIKSMIEGPIDLVMGGFHLLDERPARILKVLDSFSSVGVRRVAPCHCTGPKARSLLRDAFGKGFVDLRVGDIVEI